MCTALAIGAATELGEQGETVCSCAEFTGGLAEAAASRTEALTLVGRELWVLLLAAPDPPVQATRSVSVHDTGVGLFPLKCVIFSPSFQAKGLWLSPARKLFFYYFDHHFFYSFLTS